MEEEYKNIIDYAQSEISNVLSMCVPMNESQRERLMNLNNHLYNSIHFEMAQ